MLERNPNEPRALFLLGMLAFQRDDLPRARDLFMRATEHARDVGIYHLWLARCLRALSQLAGRTGDGRAERLAGRLHASLDYGQVDEILNEDPHAYLESVGRYCVQIHAAAYQSYITYPIDSALPA